MPQYRKKPLVVEAVQWFRPGDHPEVQVKDTLDGCLRERCADNQADHGVIPTVEGSMEVCPGDWIVGPGAEGEFWPVKASIFAKTYEPVDSAAESRPARDYPAETTTARIDALNEASRILLESLYGLPGEDPRAAFARRVEAEIHRRVVASRGCRRF